MSVALCLFCGLTLLVSIILCVSIRRKLKKRSVCIIVLGDVGRSPRMQYHALSFASEGFLVDIVGYSGSEPLRNLTNNPSVRIHYLRETPDLQILPRFLGYVVKTLWQSITLLGKLLLVVRSGCILLQNPPAVPTLPICWLYSRFSGAFFIIDWHNYAYTIMGLNVGGEHVLVKMTKFIESFFGARADRHFCVTNAMREDLENNWNIKAIVLYDRPPAEFRPIELSEKHYFFERLSKLYDDFSDDNGSSIFTECLENDEILLRKNRPGFIVSSTSWTDDEDFSILFNVLYDYELSCESKNRNLPDLVCAVTGKGPLKDFWKAIIERKTWRHVKIIMPWLENDDYPKLLACADLGICLHTSSSGLDLPMKVVDMFGCGLPVCAYNYKCLHELVRNGENGYVFNDEKELSARLKDWFEDFPANTEQLRMRSKFESELTKFRENRWHGNWSSIVIPHFD